MKENFSALVLAALVGSLSVGCGNAASTAPSKAIASEACVKANDRAGDHVYVFSAGNSPVARVVRTIRSDGSESLTGTTSLALGKLTEYAELRPDGRLEYADVSLEGSSGTKRLLVDASHGAFYAQEETSSGWHRAPADRPMVYAGLSGDSFTLAATPVSAWIAARAAFLSEDVRMLDVSLRQTRSVPRDQLVVSVSADERLVIAGQTALSVNGEFVTSLGETPTSERLPVAGLLLRPRRVASR